jgi:hypothetical protein
MTATKPHRGFTPTDAQRAFVAAAGAVGLPPEVICRMMPRAASDRVATDPATLDAQFAEERSAGPLYALRLIIARVLQRALIGEDRDAIAAQIAVFKSLTDWRRLGEAEERDGPDIDRLSPEERETLRALVAKATGEDASEA